VKISLGAHSLEPGEIVNMRKIAGGHEKEALGEIESKV